VLAPALGVLLADGKRFGTRLAERPRIVTDSQSDGFVVIRRRLRRLHVDPLAPALGLRPLSTLVRLHQWHLWTWVDRASASRRDTRLRAVHGAEPWRCNPSPCPIAPLPDGSPVTRWRRYSMGQLRRRYPMEMPVLGEVCVTRWESLLWGDALREPGSPLASRHCRKLPYSHRACNVTRWVPLSDGHPRSPLPAGAALSDGNNGAVIRWGRRFPRTRVGGRVVGDFLTPIESCVRYSMGVRSPIGPRYPMGRSRSRRHCRRHPGRKAHDDSIRVPILLGA
jgi:hypothetical protein